MRNTVLIPALPVLIPLIIGAGGCRSSRNTLNILTDRSELAPAVEMFLSDRESARVILRHVQDIDEAESADLIIGSNLNTPPMTARLQPLESCLEMYPALMGPLDSRGRPLLQALAFELPLIIGTEQSLALLPDPVIVRPRDLAAAAGGYLLRDNRGGVTRMSFSPAWNASLFTDLLAIRAPDLLKGGFEKVDDGSVDTVMDEIRSWREAAAGDVNADRAFYRKYRYLPEDVLLTRGRIQFARIDFAAWAALPYNSSRRFDIRYLSGDRLIPISAVTWAGIPNRSGNPRLAREFLDWLLLPETQGRLMDRWESEGLRVFGFLGGLSSIPAVNYTRIIDLHPRMEGMIPENHYLAPAVPVPHRWRRIRDDVVYPWFRAAMDSDSPHEKLSEVYRRWDLFSIREDR